jgi:uncharacterized Ntn-hydrolase superfamily protein
MKLNSSSHKENRMHYGTNKNRRIAQRRVGRRVVTNLARNDERFDVIVSTDDDNNSTRLKIVDENGSVFRFSGARARTLYRVLARHYGDG